MVVCVKETTLSTDQCLSLMRPDPSTGAIVTFVGYVRDFNQDRSVQHMFLEHYPGMTERVLNNIADQAHRRWPLLSVHIQHRVGHLSVGEPIVFVGVSSAHRQTAFDACNFIIDDLKNRAPFWKQEQGLWGSHWVEGRDSDQKAAQRWKAPAAL